MKSNFVRVCSSLLACLLMLVAGCGKTADDEDDVYGPQGKQPQQLTGVMMLYLDTEPGIDPYDTRVLVSADYMRMDDGVDESDFILLDRNAKVIYSISHERRSILVINNSPPERIPPGDMRLGVRSLKDGAAPRIAGKVPVHYELSMNENICRHVLTVPGLLPDALLALREFRRVLASAHMRNLDKTPEEMQDPCFLAYDVFAPDRQLQYGFPIQEWDEQGNSRNLINYDEHFVMDEALFRLPEGYGHHVMGADVIEDAGEMPPADDEVSGE